MQNLKREHKITRHRRSFTQKLLYLLNNQDNVKILEIGCSYGGNIKHLVRTGFEIYGIDISRYAINQAKQLVDKDIDLRVGIIFNLPYDDNYFDLVFTRGVLIHIHPNDFENALKEVARVSKKRIVHYEYTAKYSLPARSGKLSNGRFLVNNKRVPYIFAHEMSPSLYTDLGFENHLDNNVLEENLKKKSLEVLVYKKIN